MKAIEGKIYCGKVNRRHIVILRATDDCVTYQDLKYGTVFTVGTRLFEHCALEEVTDYEMGD